MAENKDEQLTDEELAQLQLAEENENAVDRLAAPRAASASLPPACCTCLPSAIRSASCPAYPR